MKSCGGVLSRPVMSLCWLCVGLVLSLCWLCVGSVLAVCWLCVGSVLALCWPVLALCWLCVGLCWLCVGPVLAVCCLCVGLVFALWHGLATGHGSMRAVPHLKHSLPSTRDALFWKRSSPVHAKHLLLLGGGVRNNSEPKNHVKNA